MIALLLNHLWQSSLCLGAAGLIVLALRRNSAHVRFWVWFAASLKFLVPFAALTALSTYALAPMVPPITAPITVPAVRAAEPLAKPFSAPAMVQITAGLIAPSGPSARPAARPADSATVPAFRLNLEFVLLAVWAAGFLWLAVRWVRGWLRVRALVRGAVDAPIDAPVAVKYSPSQLEPGLVGILAPVILLPQDIAQALSPEELKAVLAHELSHWRRRDNLLAAIHMMVEALFWFFPLVWWLGRRLNSERERACDESVLADGNDPQIYTHGILKVCSAYLQSPLACVAGVSGGGLKARIATILENRLVLRMSAAGRIVLSSVALVALAFPVALGLLASPVAQSQAHAALEKIAPIGREAVQSVLSPGFAGPSEIQTAGQAEQQPSATTGHRAPFHLLARKLSFPSPDWSHLLSPVSPALFVANDSLAAPVQPTSNSAPAVAAAQVGLAQSTPLSGQAAAGQAASSCEPSRIVTTVPLEAVSGSDLLTVPVSVNGASQKFLLDLSLTEATRVSPTLVEKLGLPNILPTGLNLNGVPVQSGAVSARSLNIGGITNERVRLGVLYGGQSTGSMGPDGILSGNIFKQYDVDVDFPKKKIALLTSSNCIDPHQTGFWAGKGVAVIAVTAAPDGRLTVPVTIDGHVVDAEIDTSSARTVMRRDVAERDVGLKSSDMEPVGGLEDGRHMPVQLHTFRQISIADGAIMAQNVPVLIQNYSMVPTIYWNQDLIAIPQARIPDLTIGMDILGKLHMLVVPPEAKVYVATAEPLSGISRAVSATSDNQTSVTDAARPESAVDRLRLKQAFEARAFCDAQDQGPPNPEYPRCVNHFLQAHYGWQVGQRADGSLGVSVWTHGLAQHF